MAIQELVRFYAYSRIK